MLLQPADAGDQDAGACVRSSILQGAWYPGDPAALRREVEDLLCAAKIPKVPGRICGLIAPHAGYRYSGPVAAHAYALLRGRDVKRVVLMGPSHRVAFHGASVSRHSFYETPLGRVPVDQGLVRRITQACPSLGFVREAHEREHSLEIQLPFLQCVLEDFSIVPVLVGAQDMASCEALATCLARVLKEDPSAVLLASTDLSHYHPDRTARLLDGVFTEHVRNLDPRGLAAALAKGKCEACGGGPTVALMLALQELGGGKCTVLRYATSGDATGDRGRVVGYLAAVFSLEQKKRKNTKSAKEREG